MIPRGGALRQGVDYLLVNMAWIWRTEPDPGVTADRQEILGRFFDRHARLAFEDAAIDVPRWLLVYELVPATGAPPHEHLPLLKWYRLGGLAGLARLGEKSIPLAGR